MWCDLTSNEIFEAACKIKYYKKVLRGKPVLFVLFVCVHIFCAYNVDYMLFYMTMFFYICNTFNDVSERVREVADAPQSEY